MFERRPEPSNVKTCGQLKENNARILRFLNGFYLYRDRITTTADRDGDRKLARLRRGFCFNLAIVGTYLVARNIWTPRRNFAV